jgi:hypothetical protein
MLRAYAPVLRGAFERRVRRHLLSGGLDVLAEFLRDLGLEALEVAAELAEPLDADVLGHGLTTRRRSPSR